MALSMCTAPDLLDGVLGPTRSIPKRSNGLLARTTELLTLGL